MSGPVEAKFELFVNDSSPGVRFYKHLGFEVVDRKSDGYTTLRSGLVVVCLCPITTGIPLRWFGVFRGPPLGTELVFYVKELEAMRRRLVEASYNPGLIKAQPWGLRDFRVRDPDRYYVRITEGQAVHGLSPDG